ncbi:MAG: sulfatase-like hydrolase/transferase [Bacteroidaceae bacterium]
MFGKWHLGTPNKNVRENTIVIFASDNGPWVRFSNQSESKYGDTRLKVGYATPFRDGKGSTWEGGHRVPGIISWPAKIKGNRSEQKNIYKAYTLHKKTFHCLIKNVFMFSLIGVGSCGSLETNSKSSLLI